MPTKRHALKTAILPLSLMIILILGCIGCSDDKSPTAPSSTPERIFFVSDRDGDKEIFRMNRDGSSPTNITNNNSSFDDDPH